MRSGPGYSSFAMTGDLHEGDTVDIACQAQGEVVSEQGWGTSGIWDKLTNGSWASDLYIDTPAIGKFSSGIPQC